MLPATRDSLLLLQIPVLIERERKVNAETAFWRNENVFKRLPEGNTPPTKSNPRNAAAEQLATPAGNSKLPGRAIAVRQPAHVTMEHNSKKGYSSGSARGNPDKIEK